MGHRCRLGARSDGSSQEGRQLIDLGRYRNVGLPQLANVPGQREQPEDVRAEILSINTDARDFSLQVAISVSVLASLIRLVNSLRMRRLPDIAPSASIEGAALG
jgi:hypothetical protein